MCEMPIITFYVLIFLPVTAFAAGYVSGYGGAVRGGLQRIYQITLGYVQGGGIARTISTVRFFCV